MFTSWLQCNSQYLKARSMTYGKFYSNFEYVKRKTNMKAKKKGFTIERLMWVPLSTGEVYYLRTMLIVVKGPTSYI